MKSKCFKTVSNVCLIYTIYNLSNVRILRTGLLTITFKKLEDAGSMLGQTLTLFKILFQNVGLCW